MMILDMVIGALLAWWIAGVTRDCVVPWIKSVSDHYHQHQYRILFSKVITGAGITIACAGIIYAAVNGWLPLR